MIVLASAGDIEIVGEATNGSEFLDMIDKLEPNIVLMDVMMPGMGGVEAVDVALKRHPELKIVILTMVSDREFYDKLIDAGALGYILKDSGKDELLKAIRTVVKGEKYYSPKLIHKLITNKKNYNSDPLVQNNVSFKLNRMEQNILKLICLGKTNVEISKDLSISQRTLENYKSIMINKVGAKDSLGLAIYALKNKLIDDTIEYLN